MDNFSVSIFFFQTFYLSIKGKRSGTFFNLFSKYVLYTDLYFLRLLTIFSQLFHVNFHCDITLARDYFHADIFDARRVFAPNNFGVKYFRRERISTSDIFAQAL